MSFVHVGSPQPQDKNLGRVANRFNTKANAIDPIGNSPVIIHKEMFAPLVSEWHSLALKMKRDGEASKVFGWVLEMWAYAIASAQANVQHSLHTEFMAQPPYDQEFQVLRLPASTLLQVGVGAALPFCASISDWIQKSRWGSTSGVTLP